MRSPSVETAGDSAATIVAERIERCRKRPPRTVIGQISKHVKAMLAEDIAPDDIRRGLADWMTRDLHPSVLPSLVNSAMNTRVSPPAAHPTDASIARLLGIDQPQLPGGQS